MLQLSDVFRANHPHFQLGEFLFSDQGTLAGYQNVPTFQAVWYLDRMASLLETIRTIAKVPLRVTSGFRSPDVNRLVGGAPQSFHLTGQAVDFVPVGMTFEQKKELFELIHEHLPWLTEVRLYKDKGHFHVAYNDKFPIKPHKII